MDERARDKHHPGGERRGSDEARLLFDWSGARMHGRNAAQTVSTTAPSPLVGEGITAISVKLVRVRGCLFARQSMPHETPHPACIWRCAPPSPAGGEGTPVARIQIGITISSTPADRHAAWPAISRPR